MVSSSSEQFIDHTDNVSVFFVYLHIFKCHSKDIILNQTDRNEIMELTVDVGVETD